MDRYDFEQWVDAWQNAWTHSDLYAFRTLLAPEVRWCREPFTAPLTGHADVDAAIEQAFASLEHVEFAASVLAFDAPLGVARWAARLTPAGAGPVVDTDGVLAARFDDQQRCVVLDEWWHAQSPIAR